MRIRRFLEARGLSQKLGLKTSWYYKVPSFYFLLVEAFGCVVKIFKLGEPLVLVYLLGFLDWDQSEAAQKNAAHEYKVQIEKDY